MPRFVSACTTATARAPDNATFASAVPTLSVCPTTHTRSAGLCCSNAVSSFSAGSDSGFTSALAKSK